MELVRTMTASDVECAKSLWMRRFGDSEMFTNWYFKSMFVPDASACLLVDGRFTGMILGRPVHVRIRSLSVPALLLSGVSTEEGFERRGYMHACMKYELQLARRKRCAVVLHKPVRLPVYASLGQLPVTSEQRRILSSGPALPAFSSPDPAELLAVYTAATSTYTCAVVRNLHDMQLRLQDFACDGGGCVTVSRDGRVAAYALLSPDKSCFDAPECLAVDCEALDALLALLPRGTSVKLPPDTGCGGTVQPDCAMGAVDVPLLLRTFLNDPKIAFSVTDPAVLQNNGVFSGDGAECRRPGDYAVSAGELVQFITGYRALRGVFDEAACFCLDAY